MAGQTTLDELVALMAEFRGDLHAMAKGHPFTLQEVDAALQEAMQEKQVTIGDQTFHLEEPFLVLATQNPVEQEGTYPLPEAQT